jgi:hypothetical protein
MDKIQKIMESDKALNSWDTSVTGATTQIVFTVKQNTKRYPKKIAKLLYNSNLKHLFVVQNFVT